MLIVGICAGGYKIWVINIKATTKQLATLQEGLSIAKVLSPNPSQKRGCEVVSVSKNFFGDHFLGELRNQAQISNQAFSISEPACKEFS